MPDDDTLGSRQANLARGIDGVLLAVSGQTRWLKEGSPPFTATMSDAVTFYGGPCAGLDLWLMCKAVYDLAMAWQDVIKHRPDDEPGSFW